MAVHLSSITAVYIFQSHRGQDLAQLSAKASTHLHTRNLVTSTSPRGLCRNVDQSTTRLLCELRVLICVLAQVAINLHTSLVSTFIIFPVRSSSLSAVFLHTTKQIIKMIPTLALLPILPLLALAAPSSSPAPSTDALGLSEQDRAGLILRTLDAIERETRAGRTINFDAVLSPAQRDFLGLGARQGGLEERQLLGGGDDYAPYEMPCPDDYTWVRSADVSAVHCRNDIVRQGAKEDGESRWLLPRFDGSGELNTRA